MSIRARRTPFKLRKLLVIDDDTRLLASYRDLLSPYGFEVLTANDGEQAIPLVEGPEAQREAAARARLLLDADRELVVVLAHARHLAPRLGPPFVVGLPRRVGDGQAVAEGRCALELEAEQGGQNQRTAVAVHPPGQVAFQDFDGDPGAAVGGGDADLSGEGAGRQ